MWYCFDKNLEFEYSKREMALAKINKNGILYDSDLKVFTDFSGNTIDITNQVIFPRTGVSQIYEMNNEIVKQGGIPIVDSNQIDKITSWPLYYHPSRKMQILKGKDLIKLDVITKLEKEYGKEIFLKTKEKNFNGVIEVDLLKDNQCIFYKALNYHLDEDFIISEKVDIVEDSYGLKEYRCLVVNNQIYNISRFTTTILHGIEEGVLQKAEEILAGMKKVFPSCYVMDLFEYQKDGKSYLDVAEFNPVHSSGLYLYNSVVEKSADLLHKNKKSISTEFIDTLEECTIQGKVVNDRENLYEISNSFSNDLRSIYLTGDRGVIFAADVHLTTEDFSKHKEALSLENCTPISDDEICEWDYPNIDNMFEELPPELANKFKILLKKEGCGKL